MINVPKFVAVLSKAEISKQTIYVNRNIADNFMKGRKTRDFHKKVQTMAILYIICYNNIL